MPQRRLRRCSAVSAPTSFSSTTESVVAGVAGPLRAGLGSSLGRGGSFQFPDVSQSVMHYSPLGVLISTDAKDGLQTQCATQFINAAGHTNRSVPAQLLPPVNAPLHAYRWHGNSLSHIQIV